MMKATETFADFNTRFLHLAGQARIPEEDLRPDLFDKLTLELQRTVLPVYSTLKTVKGLSDECLSLDQGLRRIKARSDRLKAQSTASTGQNSPGRTPTAPKSPVSNQNLPRTPVRPSIGGPIATTSQNRPIGIRPMYDDSRKQALSLRGACFSCGQDGHIANECPLKGKDQALAVQEVDTQQMDMDQESGKEEP